MKTTFICILNEEGQVVHESHEKTNPHLIADYLGKKGFKDCPVGFERGSFTHYLTIGFKERALHTVCMDDRKLSAILSIKTNKTDKNDAGGRAEALRVKMYSIVQCKPAEAVEKRMLLTSRKTLVQQQVQLKNTVRGLLKTFVGN